MQCLFHGKPSLGQVMLEEAKVAIGVAGTCQRAMLD